ncbi:YceI family protein [Candidatus Berkiella aquae]|uniref:YceI family protein n=1 Tax=Candidatus Berkiella aquae TaxID=295108 RepID=A0A0Q9YP23_9GAMM|nr:YceI family protein [Candidatus Berkiella aquae]MCS5712069.1 YceI family protein [Candidatus Berkiella aquae]
MKPLTKSLIAFLALFPLTGWCEKVEYKLDKSHTSVNWDISHFDFSHYHGKWEAEGKLVLDNEKPENSKVDAVIKVDEFITGNDKLNKHLKSADFFNTATYPKATFVSDKIEVQEGKIAKVHGNLTLHGVTKPVVLEVISQKIEKNPVSNKDTAGFRAKTKLKRSDFGISAFLPGLGDEVNLDIEVEANK